MSDFILLTFSEEGHCKAEEYTIVIPNERASQVRELSKIQSAAKAKIKVCLGCNMVISCD